MQSPPPSAFRKLAVPAGGSNRPLPSEPQSLEGALLQRRRHKLLYSKPRYAVLDLRNGGSFACYDSYPADSVPMNQQNSTNNVSKTSMEKRGGKSTVEMRAQLHRKESAVCIRVDKGRHTAMSRRGIMMTSLDEKLLSDINNDWSEAFDKDDDIDSDRGGGGPNDEAKKAGVSTKLAIRKMNISEKMTAIRDNIFHPNELPRLYIPSEVPWTMRDVQNDPFMFLIEIPPHEKNDSKYDDLVTDDTQLLQMNDGDSDDFLVNANGAKGGVRSFSTRLNTMVNKNKKVKLSSLKYEKIYYFKCIGGGNEKILWLNAARKLDRLAEDSAVRRKISSRTVTSRTRSIASVATADRRRAMERALSVTPRMGGGFQGMLDADALKDAVCSDGDCDSYNEDNGLDHNDAPLSIGSGSSSGDAMDLLSPVGRKEHKVFPVSAYPNRWMTDGELQEEMLMPSKVFHDLRVDPDKTDGEIGTLRVEVLECIGLPKMDRFSNTDAVSYLVCGPYGFTTDTINGKLDPIWPRKAKRACEIPIFHAHAQLFVGLFDDDGPNEHDDFIGRAVIDIASLRPGSEYDVTIALRMFATAYSRKPRGSIRLRLQLDWNSERAAVMSILPRPESQNVMRLFTGREEFSFSNISAPITIQCADLKSFRNTALTIRGAHLPARFSMKIFNAHKREFKLYQKLTPIIIKEAATAIMKWKNPFVSGYIFFAWMHCIHSGSCALVPPYVVSLVLLLLIQNYARYSTCPKAHEGLVPLTFEELLMSLVFGSSTAKERHMHPLEFNGTKCQNDSTTSNQLSRDSYQPLGTSLFKKLGFYDDDPDSSLLFGPRDHREFPFSFDERYPQISVDDARKHKPKAASPSHTSCPFGTHLEGQFPTSIIDENEDEIEVEIEDDGEEERMDEESEVASKHEEADYEEDEDQGKKCSLSFGGHKIGLLDIEKKSEHKKWKRGALINRVKAKMHSGGEPSVISRQVSAHLAEPKQLSGLELKLSKLPEQDIDVRVKAKKPLADELLQDKNNLQNSMLRIFDDRVYSFTEEVEKIAKQSVKHDLQYKSGEVVDSELDRHLGIHSYSNPVLAKTASYASPLVQVSHMFLCMVRSIFNLFMWKNPYLSFWLCLACIFAIVVLIFFPWRLFLCVVGMIGLGPQNWVLRVHQQRRRGKLDEFRNLGVSELSLGSDRSLDSKDSPSSATKERRRFFTRKRSGPLEEPENGEEDSPDLAVCSVPALRPIFLSHTAEKLGSMRSKLGRHTHHDFEHAVHEVVVPYSRFRFARFYDWPPDPTHARVTKGRTGHQQRRLVMQESIPYEPLQESTPPAGYLDNTAGPRRRRVAFDL